MISSDFFYKPLSTICWNERNGRCILKLNGVFIFSTRTPTDQYEEQKKVFKINIMDLKPAFYYKEDQSQRKTIKHNMFRDSMTSRRKRNIIK